MRHAIERAEAAGASRIDLTAHVTKDAGRRLRRALRFRRRDSDCLRLELSP